MTNGQELSTPIGPKALDALADPSRRAIVQVLAASPRPVGALAQELPISRPAVSQHLRVLSDAGLVTSHAEGTRRIYALRAEGLREMRAYLDQLWTDALAQFAAAAQSDAQDLPQQEPPNDVK